MAETGTPMADKDGVTIRTRPIMSMGYEYVQVHYTRAQWEALKAYIDANIQRSERR